MESRKNNDSIPEREGTKASLWLRGCPQGAWAKAWRARGSDRVTWSKNEFDGGEVDITATLIGSRNGKLVQGRFGGEKGHP